MSALYLSLQFAAGSVLWPSLSLFSFPLIYLLLKDKSGDKADSRLAQTLPSLKVLDEITYKLIFVGLPFLTIMLVTGAVWAEYAWGAFWSWDPKEVWALITLLVYSVPLHHKSIKFLQTPKYYHLYMLLAFLTVLMTYFGVNYILGGMHSYA